MANSTDEQPDIRSAEKYTYAHSSAALRALSRRTAEKEAAFLLPHLRPGMVLLDVGCGQGTITIGLARAVAPGEVVGIDIDPGQIELAQRNAADQNVPNLRLETASIYELPFPDGSFDAVFSNAVLEHLADPLAALGEIHRVLKAGGVVGIANGDVDGWLVYPFDSLLQRSLQIHFSRLERNGSNPRLGKQQRGLLHSGGFVNVQALTSSEYFGTEEAVRFVAHLFVDLFREEKTIEQIVEYSLAERSEVESMSTAWQEWGERPDAFWANPHCEAVGWKA